MPEFSRRNNRSRVCNSCKEREDCGGFEYSAPRLDDHGNADEMYDHKKDGTLATNPDGTYKLKTSHTLNQVPYIIYAPALEGLSLNTGIEKPGLGNVAATNFNLLGFEAPDDYLPSLLKV